ncbi:MAG: hypothetical protein WCJ49_05860 [Deltaproteobacteria bacterium]
MIKLHKKFFVLTMLLWLVFFSSCTSSRYGSFSIDEGVTKEFTTFAVDTDCRYFISGSDLYPRSILALNNRYDLQNDFWKLITMTPSHLKELVSNMEEKASFSGMKGYVIMNDKNVAIGKWFSLMSQTTMVEILNNNTVIVYTPSQSDNCYEPMFTEMNQGTL